MSFRINYSFNVSGLGKTGVYVFPGQRAEIYDWQSIWPGAGGKYTRIPWAKGCTVINGNS